MDANSSDVYSFISVHKFEDFMHPKFFWFDWLLLIGSTNTPINDCLFDNLIDINGSNVCAILRGLFDLLIAVGDCIVPVLGAYVIGDVVGFKLGLLLGLLLGLFVGVTDGLILGLKLGLFVGLLLGDIDGYALGFKLGPLVGANVSPNLVGCFVGDLVGISIGDGVGLIVICGVILGLLLGFMAIGPTLNNIPIFNITFVFQKAECSDKK